MDAIQVKLSTEQILSAVRQLPKEVKMMLIQEWIREFQEESDLTANLRIEGFEEPFDLDYYAIKEAELEPLRSIWDDELPAEELVKMLSR
ncbi:MAG: hypothetical protein KDD06_24215 [Phaeodactylibacter sp.]|nr:hypothetical protein [Phaeodactylibacter sp.]